MFIGHFAVAFAAKRAAPAVSLGTWFTSYPWTHSLLMCAAWALGMAVLYWLFQRDKAGAIVIGIVVLSHWFLDAIAHRPDLPLAPGSDQKVGLGLWNSVAGTLLVESAMFAAGLWFYMAGSRPRDRTGRYGFLALVALLVISYVSAAFGPLPPSVAAIAWTGLAGGIIFGALGYWIDRHRTMGA